MVVYNFASFVSVFKVITIISHPNNLAVNIWRYYSSPTMQHVLFTIHSHIEIAQSPMLIHLANEFIDFVPSIHILYSKNVY